VPRIAIRNAALLSDGRYAYFRSAESGWDLWRTDGTAAGTVKLASLPSNGPVVGNIGPVLFLTSHSDEHGSELWSVDLDTGDFGMVADIDPRTVPRVASGTPRYGVVLGSEILFPASNIAGEELWESDGTAAGTKLLANIAPEIAGGTISGVVTDELSGTAVAAAIVTVCSTDRCDSTGTGDDGAYLLSGVLAGTYSVYAGSSLHLSEFYPDPVAVTAGHETAGIDFALARGNTISGTVTRASNGEPLRTDILIRNASGQQITRTTSSSGTGEFRTRPLAPGTYYAETRSAGFTSTPAVDQMFDGHDCSPSPCHWSGGTGIVMTAGTDVTGIDFSLREYGTIAGTIRDASTGLVLAGAFVTFTRTGGSSAGAHTDANGNYLSPLLNPGHYTVQLSAAGFLAITHEELVTVPVDGAITGIDASLTPDKGRLTGIVRDSADGPLTGVTVSLFSSGGAYTGHRAETDGAGRYALNSIPPGTYYVLTVNELHPNVDCYSSVCNVAGATAVVLVEGQTKTLNMKVRSRRITISGVAVDAQSGEPLEDVGVDLETSSGNDIAFGWSDRDGAYTVTEVSRETSFRIATRAAGYHDLIHPAMFAAGTHTGVELRLQRLGSISGRVVNARTGLPVASAGVFFRHSSGGTGNTFTDDDGRYRWPAAQPGSYFVYINPGQRFDGQVYPGRACGATCDPATGDAVTVVDGADTPGIDFALTPRGGRITGRVVDDLTGAGMADVYVAARREYDSFSARTDADGYYTIESDGNYVLVSGTYTLYAETQAPYYTALYGGTHCPDFYACNFTGGTPVQVTAPNDTAGINFRMIRVRITGISPAQGSTGGGTRVAINGANFTAGATVRIGGHLAAIVSRTATQLVVTTPPGPAGPAHVTVTLSTTVGVTLTHAFTYGLTGFTDEPLLAGTSVLRAIHVTELREAVNALRATASLALFPFTDPSLTGKRIRGVHLLELRTALDQARAALGRPVLTYKYPPTGLVRATDVTELRNGVR